MPTDRSAESKSIGQYLIDKLIASGVRDVFGIPGDYVLTFYTMLESSPLRIVGCTARTARLCRRRLCPGKRHGGGLRDVLRRRAEPVQLHRRGLCREVPVVVISGSPGLDERRTIRCCIIRCATSARRPRSSDNSASPSRSSPTP